MLHNPYCSTFIYAERCCGKTTMLRRMIFASLMSHTKLVVFRPSVQDDTPWIQTMEELKAKDVDVLVYPQIMNGKINNLETFIRAIPKSRGERSKIVDLKYLFVFDGVDEELRNRVVTMLVGMTKQLYAACIFTSDSIRTAPSSVLKRCSTFILFKFLTPEDLVRVHGILSLVASVDKFEKLYELATAEPFGYLHCDRSGFWVRKMIT